MFGLARLPRRSPTPSVAGAAVGLLCLAASLTGHSRVTTRLSWHADIRPIVERHCLSCHTGREATVSLDTYSDARPWARAIREEVLERRMPPWFARPGGARFANERRLSPVEIDLLVAWADGGAPEGKRARDEGAQPPATASADSVRALDDPRPHGDEAGPERGVVLPPGATRAKSTARWTALVPHCPSPLGSLSVSLEPPAAPLT